jgi:hypothetical protein
MSESNLPEREQLLSAAAHLQVNRKGEVRGRLNRNFYNRSFHLAGSRRKSITEVMRISPKRIWVDQTKRKAMSATAFCSWGQLVPSRWVLKNSVKRGLDFV